MALERFVHPRCCVYLLGAEDGGIPTTILERCSKIVSINTPMYLNVATAGSIVLYDRQAKQYIAKAKPSLPRANGEGMCQHSACHPKSTPVPHVYTVSRGRGTKQSAAFSLTYRRDYGCERQVYCEARTKYSIVDLVIE